MKFLKKISWTRVVLFVIIPIILGYYLFFLDPQSQFSVNVPPPPPHNNITSYFIYPNTITNSSIDISGPSELTNGGPVALLRTVFSSIPGFGVYLACFTDLTTFNPPATSNQKITMYVKTNENKTYTIGEQGNRTCIPISYGEDFSGHIFYKAKWPIELYPGQSANLTGFNLTLKADDWSASGKVLVFLFAWDTIIILISEIFSRIYRADK